MHIFRSFRTILVSNVLSHGASQVHSDFLWNMYAFLGFECEIKVLIGLSFSGFIIAPRYDLVPGFKVILIFFALNLNLISYLTFSIQFAFVCFFFFFPLYGHTCGIWKFLGWSQIGAAAEACISAMATYTTAGSNDWVRPGIKPTSSQRQRWILNPLSHNENSCFCEVFWSIFVIIIILYSKFIAILRTVCLFLWSFPYKPSGKHTGKYSQGSK